MAKENIILLAIGFTLLTLNMVFGQEMAAAIARMFRFFGVRSRSARLDDYDDVFTSSEGDSEPTISGVRPTPEAMVGHTRSESPLPAKKVAGARD
jgi:hypothetical protein